MWGLMLSGNAMGSIVETVDELLGMHRAELLPRYVRTFLRATEKFGFR